MKKKLKMKNFRPFLSDLTAEYNRSGYNTMTAD